LSDILAGYSTSSNELATSDVAVAAADDDDDEVSQQRPGSSTFTLERSWTDVVHDHESLDKRQRDYQEAVWELLSTELEHISKLRVVVDVRITPHTRTPLSRHRRRRHRQHQRYCHHHHHHNIIIIIVVVVIIIIIITGIFRVA